MRTILFILTFVIGFSANAQVQSKESKKEKTETKQNTPKDVQKETEIKTIQIKKGNGQVEEKKIKVTTTKEETIKTVPLSNHYENSKRVETPIKVTKTVAVDLDSDPFYDKQTEVIYYTNENQDYIFRKKDDGIEVSYVKDRENTIFGKAVPTSVNKFYLLNTDEYSGMAYFNTDGDFVVEYYDKDQNKIIVKTFESSSL